MRNTATIILVLVYTLGCEEQSTSDELMYDSKDGRSTNTEIKLAQPSNSGSMDSAKSITAEAVKILNMLLNEVPEDGARRIDEIAKAFDWRKLNDDVAKGGNAQSAYLALKTEEGGIIVAHRGSADYWSIAVAEAFDKDKFFKEVSNTLSLEKLKTEYKLGQATTYYLVREKTSSHEIGVIALTTSKNKAISGHGAIGWLSTEAWNRMNSE